MHALIYLQIQLLAGMKRMLIKRLYLNCTSVYEILEHTLVEAIFWKCLNYPREY